MFDCRIISTCNMFFATKNSRITTKFKTFDITRDVVSYEWWKKKQWVHNSTTLAKVDK